MNQKLSKYGMPERPKIGDASGAALLGALALGILARDWKAALAGGELTAGLANQKQPLELAVREHFKSKGLDVLFFYRAPRSVKVTFSYAPSSFWTVESIVPDELDFVSDEERDDWLYGNLVTKQLPKTLRGIPDLALR